MIKLSFAVIDQLFQMLIMRDSADCRLHSESHVVPFVWSNWVLFIQFQSKLFDSRIL